MRSDPESAICNLQSAISLLEFPALLAILQKFARTPAGRRRVDALAPSQDLAALQSAFALAREATAYLKGLAKGERGLLRLDFAGLEDTDEIRGRLHVEGVALETPEITALLVLLERADEFKQALGNVRERFPALAQPASRIGDFRSLLKEMSGKILPDGRLDDHASPALHRLRREIEKQQSAIQQSLERFLSVHGADGVLQDELITIRNDRYVVPVKSGMKRRIDGVVHGASSSGQTLFVEPLETIERNNELVDLREQEAQEVHRILREMTRRLRERAPELDAAAEAVVELDVAFAKGGFAVEFDAVIPEVGGSRLRLKDARHPVLQDVLRARRSTVVPMSLDLDRENHVLVISGPNTGGKTVALKTAGLLALAAQAGIPITATEAEFPLFDQVLADIGDYQSIEANLSTFSAHLTNIEAMIERVTPDSLVLLDELGGATDPQEGGALAVAIVEHFLNSGAFTIASTHHLALKAYATTNAGVVNASVGFDEQTLQPTYRLLLGVPGKSAGISIAQRLGLKREVLERARQALSSQDEEVGRLLARLHESVEDADRLRAEAQRLEQSLKEQNRDLSAVWEKREKAKLAELEKQLGVALARMEAEGRAAVEKIADKQARKEAERAVAHARELAREEFDSTVVETLGAQARPAAPATPLEVKEGVTVRVKNLGRTGTVRRRISDDLWEVEVGLMRVRAARADLEAAAPAVQPKPQVRVTTTETSAAPVEINVIGCTAEEALERVDKYLDSAVLSVLPRVRIVHGHGKNILKNALAKMLSSHPQVERFYPAESREGGSGATIVELRV